MNSSRSLTISIRLADLRQHADRYPCDHSHKQDRPFLRAGSFHDVERHQSSAGSGPVAPDDRAIAAAGQGVKQQRIVVTR